VKLVVSLFLALVGMVIAYAFGQGGPVGAMVFFAILFGGAVLHYAEPLLERLRP
jgi:hypothetical protein